MVARYNLVNLWGLSPPTQCCKSLDVHVHSLAQIRFFPPACIHITFPCSSIRIVYMQVLFTHIFGMKKRACHFDEGMFRAASSILAQTRCEKKTLSSTTWLYGFMFLCVSSYIAMLLPREYTAMPLVGCLAPCIGILFYCMLVELLLLM